MCLAFRRLKHIFASDEMTTVPHYFFSPPATTTRTTRLPQPVALNITSHPKAAPAQRAAANWPRSWQGWGHFESVDLQRPRAARLSGYAIFLRNPQAYVLFGFAIPVARRPWDVLGRCLHQQNVFASQFSSEVQSLKQGTKS